MCGIFGFTNLNQKNRNMAWLLAYSMENRGADSWGASDGNEIIKFSGPISSSFYLPKHWKQVIVHTRSASISLQDGKAAKENAHPFLFDGKVKKVIGCHNGYVSNRLQLDQQYQPFPVDSMHVFHHMAEGLPLEDLEGRGTLAWFEPRDGRMQIHLTRWNYGDLEVALEEDDGGVVFCSNDEPILRAARLCRVKLDTMYQKLVDSYTHIFDGKELIKLEKFGFREKPIQTLSTYTPRSHGVATQYPLGEFTACRKCGVCHTLHVICLNCMKTMRQQFELEWPKMKEKDRTVLNWGGFVKV